MEIVSGGGSVTYMDNGAAIPTECIGTMTWTVYKGVDTDFSLHANTNIISLDTPPTQLTVEDLADSIPAITHDYLEFRITHTPKSSQSHMVNN